MKAVADVWTGLAQMSLYCIGFTSAEGHGCRIDAAEAQDHPREVRGPHDLLGFLLLAAIVLERPRRSVCAEQFGLVMRIVGAIQRTGGRMHNAWGTRLGFGSTDQRRVRVNVYFARLNRVAVNLRRNDGGQVNDHRGCHFGHQALNVGLV